MDGRCDVSDAYCVNADIEQPVGTRVNIGGGASAVAARTAAILSSKKWCRSHTSTAGDSGNRPRPIRTSSDCQAVVGHLMTILMPIYS